MLEFKKYFSDQFLKNEINKYFFKNLYKTVKKSSCGNKSCSRGSDGYNYDDYYNYHNDYKYSAENIIELKIKDNNFKYYFDKERQILILEKIFNKLIADQNDIKEINDYLEKNKNLIINNLNSFELVKEVIGFKYKNHKIFNNKISIYYNLQ